MKSKKHKQAADTASHNDSAGQIRQKRRQEKIKDKTLRAEKNRTDIFKRRVRDASEHKAPKTLRTKAYYRFSKEFPSEVNTEGFRENTPESKKLSKKKTVILALACIFLFTAAFTLTHMGITLSRKGSVPKTEPPEISSETSLRGLHIGSEDLRSKTAQEIQKTVTEAGCNMAVFEFKNEDGHIFFPVTAASDTLADRAVSSAEEKIKALSENGIKCAAYISCFKDSTASQTELGITTASGGNFIDDNDFSWFNPYSGKAHSYLLSIISEADGFGFSYIFLDNVCFPTNFTEHKPYFENSSSRNAVLTTFINSALERTKNASVVVICDITGFTDISTIPDEKYEDSLLSSDSTAFCLDLRTDYQNMPQLASSDMFNYVKEMPLAFILDAGALAKETLTQEKEATLIMAIVDRSLDNAEKYAESSGISNVIIW